MISLFNNHLYSWSSVVTLPTEEDLNAFGAAFARRLRAGDVVALSGPLGSGKTTLVRAIVRTLHGADQSSSPSFTFRHRYDGEPPIDHIDFFRIEDPREIVELGLEDALDGRSIVLVEWWRNAPGCHSVAPLRNRYRRRRRTTTHVVSSRTSVNVLALDGALGAFSAAVAVDGAIVATKCESGNVALERGLADRRRGVGGGEPARRADRPLGSRRRARRFYRLADCNRLCEIARRGLGAPARSDRFVRSARVWRLLRPCAQPSSSGVPA